jgi:hypothetical protein
MKVRSAGEACRAGEDGAAHKAEMKVMGRRLKVVVDVPTVVVSRTENRRGQVKVVAAGGMVSWRLRRR